MNIDKIAAGVQNTIPAGKIQDTITTSLLTRGLEDIFEAQKPFTKVQNKVLQFADEVWQDMKMPEKIKPQIVFRCMPPTDLGGTDLGSCKMFLPNDDFQLITNMAVSRGMKATLAHELRHTKQAYSIAQLIGPEELERIALEKRNIVLDRGWFEYVIEELGRIEPDSKEGEYAKKCLNAYVNYPKMERFQTPGESRKNYRIYKRNFLETDARKFEKNYQESRLKLILAAIKNSIKKS